MVVNLSSSTLLLSLGHKKFLNENIVVAHTVLVQLVHLDPLFLDPVEKFLFLGQLVLAPLRVLFFENRVQESLVLLERLQLINVLVDLRLNVLNICLCFLDVVFRGFSFTDSFV